MANKIANTPEETQIEVLENMDNALNASEAFIEKYQKQIFIGVGLIALAIVAVICIKSLYLEPREQAASEDLFKVEQLFARDSFQLALNGSDELKGFLDIVDEYGSTKAGNLAKAYAGLCYKNLGENEKAIEYLNKFSADDQMIQYAVIGAVGDCYWDMEETEKSISYYKKAASSAKNEVLTPFYNHRAAKACLSIDKKSEAASLLESIKKDYPMYPDMMEVDKLLQYAK